MSNFGRILHFTYPDGHTYAGRVFPAIVTREYEQDGPDGDDSKFVDLCVFSATPDVLHEVLLDDEPERGCAHSAQLAGGNWSTTRYVDELGEACDELPEDEDDIDPNGDNDDDEDREVLQEGDAYAHAAEQPIEFAPELQGLGTPIQDTSTTDTDVYVSGVAEVSTPQPATYIAPDGIYQSTGGTPVKITDDNENSGNGGAAPV